MPVDSVSEGGKAGFSTGDIDRLLLAQADVLRWRGLQRSPKLGVLKRLFGSVKPPEGKQFFLGAAHLYEATPADGGHFWRRVDVRDAKLSLEDNKVVVADGEDLISIGVDDLDNLSSLLTLLNINDPFSIEASEKGIQVPEWPLRAAGV